jgi:hypothetical protein
MGWFSISNHAVPCPMGPHYILGAGAGKSAKFSKHARFIISWLDLQNHNCSTDPLCEGESGKFMLQLVIAGRALRS